VNEENQRVKTVNSGSPGTCRFKWLIIRRLNIIQFYYCSELTLNHDSVYLCR